MSAIAMKDNLLELLSVDDDDALLENITRITSALELTWPMWMEAGYAYKGNEILERCILECNRQLGFCQHYKRIRRLERIKNDAMRVAGIFVAAQHEYMYGGK